MANSAPGIIFGPYGIQSRSFEEQEEIFSLLLKHNVTALDTAYSYVCHSAIVLLQTSLTYIP
jgi:hypothetical protein